MEAALIAVIVFGTLATVATLVAAWRITTIMGTITAPEPGTLIERRLRQTVIVNHTNGSSTQGLLLESDDQALLLASTTDLTSGIEYAGEVWIPAHNVASIQITEPKGRR